MKLTKFWDHISVQSRQVVVASGAAFFVKSTDFKQNSFNGWNKYRKPQFLCILKGQLHEKINKDGDRKANIIIWIKYPFA